MKASSGLLRSAAVALSGLPALVMIFGVLLVTAIRPAAHRGAFRWDSPSQGIAGGGIALLAASGGAWLMARTHRMRIRADVASVLALLLTAAAALGALLLLRSTSLHVMPIVERGF
ncbi:MAG: hypothetical protein WDA27_14520 [Actinomycetota bacterium]